MPCLRCGKATEDHRWTHLLHYCTGCAPLVLPPAPFMTWMARGTMQRAGKWPLFPHEWFYRHDPRYNPKLRTIWRNWVPEEDCPSLYPSWW